MKRIYKWVALFVVSVLLVCSFSGCGMLDEETGTPSSNGGSEKGLLDDLDGLLDDLLSDSGDTSSYSDDDDYGSSSQSSSDDDLLGSLFDAFFGAKI